MAGLPQAALADVGRARGGRGTETSYASHALPWRRDFMRNESTGDREAHVMVAWKERPSDDDGPKRTYFVSETIGGGGTDQRRALGALAVALRTALLEPDAAAQQLPVVDLDGLVDRALSYPSDMAHFFRVLADPHATFDKEVPASPMERAAPCPRGVRESGVNAGPGRARVPPPSSRLDVAYAQCAGGELEHDFGIDKAEYCNEGGII